MDTVEIKKSTPQEKQRIIGCHPSGGVIELDGKYYWLRHPIFRRKYQDQTMEGDDVFSQLDIEEVGCWLTPPDRRITTMVVEKNLEILKEGDFPPNFTIGIEIEGCLYDLNGNLIPKHINNTSAAADEHPELLAFMVETATKPKNNHPSNPLEIAQRLAEAVIEGYQIAKGRGGIIVYSSVPEAGYFYQAQITPHPYILSFAPKVLSHTLRNWDKIPQQVEEVYKMLGIDIFNYLQQTGILHWPVNALHIHNGIPEIENFADPRIAYAYGKVRQTVLAKIVSFLLYNTNYLYGTNTGLKDVRSILRRLLATTIDASIPPDSKSLLERMINELTTGEIHSPSRYPAAGQHDRTRFRFEYRLKTVESIDAPMTPDLRSVLGWAFFNQILNVVALDAMKQTKGDESKVINYLEQTWGDVFQVLPTMGEYSSFSHDLTFNKSGLNGKSGGETFRKRLLEIKEIIRRYGMAYPAIHPQSQIVSHLIDLFTSPLNKDLMSFLGIESGVFTPNNKNQGLITEAKQGLNPQELTMIQSQATEQQAKCLLFVNDLSSLFDYFGLQ